MGFSGYFLIVQDFINWAKQHGVPVGPGRGSGAGSIVAWALRITDIDPIRWGLLFERFLNPDRVSMPDFDIDFCQDRRDEVITYVRGKYGRDNVGQIITFGSLKARSVIRDVVRVMGLPFAEGDRIAKLVPDPVQGKTAPLEGAGLRRPGQGRQAGPAARAAAGRDVPEAQRPLAVDRRPGALSRRSPPATCSRSP